MVGLDPADQEGQPAARLGVRVRRGRTVARIAMEVLLIGAGVFLALLGDQWRENAEHHELAEASLRRFRAEFAANRDAVAAVGDRHVADLKLIQAYYNADAQTQKELAWPFTGLNPAFLEYSAWDLALATQSLAYIDADLAQSISRTYAVQHQLDELTRGVTQVLYLRTGESNPHLRLGPVAVYFGDCVLIEPRLLAAYDSMLTELDAALGATDTVDGGR